MEAELVEALDEISILHKLIGKQAKKISLLRSQLEGIKTKEVELLQLLQEKVEEVIKAKEETAEI